MLCFKVYHVYNLNFLQLFIKKEVKIVSIIKERISYLRNENNLSHEQIISIPGVCKRAIVAYEQGVREPDTKLCWNILMYQLYFLGYIKNLFGLILFMKINLLFYQKQFNNLLQNIILLMITLALKVTINKR